MKKKLVFATASISVVLLIAAFGIGIVNGQETTDGCEIKEYRGVPTLHINGEPKFATIVWDFWPGVRYGVPVTESAMRYTDRKFRENTANFAKTGCHIYLFTSSLGWTEKEGVYDYKFIEKQVEQILKIDPDAYLMPRFHMGAFTFGMGVCKFPGYLTPMASWWYEKHPAELIKTDEGKILPEPSFASKIWRKDAGNALKNYINHFESKPYADRFIGYFVGFGTWAECNYRGSYSNCGKPMLTGFREWLKEKYKGDVSLLRSAWGNNTVSFATAQPPNSVDKIKTDLGFFVNPSNHNQSPDYKKYRAELIADNIIYFCEIAKKAAKGNIICGTAYGALMNTGNVVLEKILESPAVDFLENPHSYRGRELGTGDCSFMSVTESIKLHGMLKINETDTRTFLHTPGERKTYGGPDDVKGSIEILKRDFGQILCRSVGHWWLAPSHCSTEPGRYPFDHPKLWETIKKLNKIGDISMEYDRSYAGGIAMIVDEDSMFYHSFSSGVLQPMLYRQRMEEFGRIGTPWDVYLHNDLSHPDMPDYKVYLFLNIFYLTDEEKDEIKKKVCKNNNIVIWMYAPGFQTPEGFSLESVCELTGMNVKYVNGHSTLGVIVTDRNHPFAKGMGHYLGMRRWGRQTRPLYAPTFYVDDPSVTIIGKMDVINKAGFCVKDMGNWTSVYVGTSAVTAKVLRNICRYAGVHIYSDTEDLLYANKHFVVISTREAGKKTIKLPRRTDVYEIYENRLIGKNITEFTETLPAKVTRIYLLKK